MKNLFLFSALIIFLLTCSSKEKHDLENGSFNQDDLKDFDIEAWAAQRCTQDDSTDCDSSQLKYYESGSIANKKKLVSESKCVKEEIEDFNNNRCIWEQITTKEVFSLCKDKSECDYLFCSIKNYLEIYKKIKDNSNLCKGLENQSSEKQFITNEWIKVPGGTFVMGFNGASDIEKPEHEVTLSSYSILKYEVSVAEYLKCKNAGVCKTFYDELNDEEYTEKIMNHPITNINWEQARSYCCWIGGDLPTEAQWEFAAKGTDNGRYPWGNNAPKGGEANYCGAENPQETIKCGNDKYEETAPVGTFEKDKSPFGIFDMAGNVNEYTKDVFNKKINFYAQCKSNCKDPYNSEYLTNLNVVRGGGFYASEFTMTTTFREGETGPSNHTGFRCAK